MPNWTSCTLSIRGPQQDRDAFQAKIQYKPNADGDTLPQLLESFLPVPEELRMICSGSTKIDEQKFTRWRTYDTEGALVPPGDEYQKVVTRVGLTSEEEERLRALYGEADWYEWSLANWGCKWPDSDTVLKVMPRALVFRFTTPWSPPTTAIETLSHAWPTLTFRLQWVDEGDDEVIHAVTYKPHTLEEED